jgi:hypothetical protein
MSEMVDRVARVLYALYSDHNWDQQNSAMHELNFERARAAIEAMREPTEEGILNGLVPVVRDPKLLQGDARELVKAIWQGVIDEALE